MARFNEIMVGRYNRFLQKLLSIKGGPPSPQLTSEIGVTFALFSGAENRYLESFDRFASFSSQGAVAAVTSTIRMRNPVGSNMIAVFERITVTNVAGAADFPTLNIGPATAELATTVVLSANAFDSRGRPNPTMLQSRTTAAAALAGQVFEIAVPLGQSGDFITTDIHEFPLLPGSAIQVTTTTVNQRLDVSWMWRERFLEESERT